MQYCIIVTVYRIVTVR